MTATLPAPARRLIQEVLSLDETSIVELDSNEQEKYTRHKLFCENKEITEESVYQKIHQIYSQDPKSRQLIVANTVQRAADIAKHLQNQGLPVKLAHSRFTQKDRAKLEKEIFDPHIRILVATQIVEVSLDISFTHLHTDCAPMDALLQRAGRVNRHLNLETGRPLLPLSPVYVYMYPHKYPYSQSSVEDSWQALLTWQESHSENILYPSDTQELIENALPPMKAQAWEDEIRMRRNRWRHTIFDLQQPLTVNPQLEQAFENLFEPTISVVPESYHQAFTNGIQQGNILQALQYSLSVPKKWLGWYKDSISQPTDQYMQYNIYQIITQGQPWVYDPSSGLLLRK